MIETQQNIREQLEIKKGQLHAILEITQAINQNIAAQDLFKLFKFVVQEHIGAKKVCGFIHDFESWNCIEKTASFYELPTNLKQQISELKQVQKINSEIDYEWIIPVFHKEQLLAFILLGEFESLFNDEKIDFATTLSNIILVAIENKRLFRQQINQEKLDKELQLASEVQNMFVPDSLPQNEWCNMSVIYQPHKNIGGDYYDFIELNDEEFAFCIGDVSGKGIGAALLMSNFQANFRALILKEIPLTQFISWLNHKVLEITKGDKFITFFVGKYHIPTRKLSYVNAGHNPPILLNGSDIEELHKGSTILGNFDEFPIEQGEITIKKDAILMLYTDGLTDVENSNQENFDAQKVENFIKSHQSKSVEQINNLLLEEIKSFSNNEPFPDDISVLTCRFK